MVLIAIISWCLFLGINTQRCMLRLLCKNWFNIFKYDHSVWFYINKDEIKMLARQCPVMSTYWIYEVNKKTITTRCSLNFKSRWSFLGVDHSLGARMYSNQFGVPYDPFLRRRQGPCSSFNGPVAVLLPYWCWMGFEVFYRTYRDLLLDSRPYRTKIRRRITKFDMCFRFPVAVLLRDGCKCLVSLLGLVSNGFCNNIRPKINSDVSMFADLYR